MGDESAVSGMSEVSTADQSTAQGAPAAGSSRVVLLSALFLISLGAAVGILFVMGAFQSEDVAGTEADDSGTGTGGGSGGGGSGGGSIGDGGSASGGDSASGGGSGSDAGSPDGGGAKDDAGPPLVMCTTTLPTPDRIPPKGLCDVFVYDADKETFSSKPEDFVNYCKQGETACGLNIKDPNGVLQQLDTPVAKKAVKDFYAAGIKHYGILRSSIAPSTKMADLQDKVDLLKKLQGFMNVAGDDRDLLFWGVSTLLEGASTPPDAMVQLFLDVLKAASINLVVYQTTYTRNITAAGDDCVSTGPAMWKSAPLSTQPTFVDALIFRKALKDHSLPVVKEMLAFSLCGYWTHYDNVKKQETGWRTGCTYTHIGDLERFICPGGEFFFRYSKSSLEPERQQHVTGDQDQWIGAYDLSDTIIKKICMASVDYGYHGGWVVHDVQCRFEKLCGAQDVGGYPRLRAVKYTAQQTFQKC